ncbi:hypothetical protein EYF80_040657 [Liparis tanakae]|uniref:Uncharacterized protein n=1 Tax=Liparis tanakae TaxID=230148 RepID=A0A4Z2G6K1_9TELE|nr:hypothetical protein EYF80_040657 [Liparis tanakae]
MDVHLYALDTASRLEEAERNAASGTPQRFSCLTAASLRRDAELRVAPRPGSLGSSPGSAVQFFFVSTAEPPGAAGKQASSSGTGCCVLDG